MLDTQTHPAPEADCDDEDEVDNAVVVDEPPSALDAAMLERKALEQRIRATAAKHLAMLDDMQRMGMDIAGVVWRQTMARDAQGQIETKSEGEPEAPTEAPKPGERDPALAYHRATRAVRLSMAMEKEILAEELERLTGVEAQAKSAQAARAGADDGGFRARIKTFMNHARESAERLDTVRQAVEGLVRAQVPEGGRACELLGEIRESLVDEEDWDPWCDQPVEAAIERLARKLGLDPDGPKWTPPPPDPGAEDAAGGAGSPPKRKPWIAGQAPMFHYALSNILVAPENPWPD